MTMRQTLPTGLAAAGLVLAAGLALAAGQYGPGASDKRDQDRQHHAVQRSGLGLRHHRQIERRLLRHDQRAGRHQRPQDQLHQSRRRLQPAQDRRAGAQAGRGGPGAVPVRHARHAAEQRHPRLSQRQQGAAAVRRHRRRQVERSEELSLDHGLAAELPHRGAHLRPLHPQEPAGRQDRDPLSERRFRQGLSRSACAKGSATRPTS